MSTAGIARFLSAAAVVFLASVAPVAAARAQPRLDLWVSADTATQGELPHVIPASSQISASPIDVDLSGWSGVDIVPQELVTGANPERYSRIRKGPSIGYKVQNLRSSSNGRYDIEVYMAERASLCPGAATFGVYFTSDPDAAVGPPLFTIDLCASGTLRGAVRAAKVAILGTYLPMKSLRLSFEAVSGNAAISQIRIAPQGGLETNAQVIPSDESRLDYRHHSSDSYLPARALDFSKLDVREVVLSRFGSRHTVVASPQRLGFMYSALGVDAADLQELIVLVKVGGTLRAFPLTDRYPLFDTVRQTDSATSMRMEASDPVAGIRVSLDVTAPFWPQDEQTTLLPSSYFDIAVTNTSSVAITPEISIGIPVFYDARDSGICPSCGPREITPVAGLRGAAWSSIEAVGEQSTPGSGAYGESRSARVDYALVPTGASITDVVVSGAEGADANASSLWLPASTGSGIPKTGARIFRRFPRGHAGLEWMPASLQPGNSVSAGAILASHVTGVVAKARISSGNQADYKFRYDDYYGDLTSVVTTASFEEESQLSRARQFDSLVSGSIGPSLGVSMQNESAALRRLLSLAFRSYAANAWWLSKSAGSSALPDEFFTVAEGAGICCRFQSTVDVAYNDAQVLLALWPSLLGKLLDVWPLYSYGGGGLPGKVVPHDIGRGQDLRGQVYIDMPVEENTNYTLLAYAQWKATADSASASTRLQFIKDVMTYVEAADTNRDGLPELGVANTIDAANPTLFRSPGQIYLGLKSAAAARAALEMSVALGDSDQAFRNRMDELHHRVLHTIENAAWRGDHFAASLDSSSDSAPLRNFGSIYPAGTLIFNLLYGGDLPVSPSVLDRMRLDASAVASRTTGPYGSVHMEQGEISGWASQSMLRDMAASMLGPSPGGGFQSNLVNYLAWQDLLSRTGDGGWWDTFTYTGSAEAGFGADTGPTSRGVLGYYPRGAVLFGYAQSFAGITIDRHSGILGAMPWARPGARVPLYSLADWSSGTVPVAVVQPTSPPSISIENPTPASSSLTRVARQMASPSVQPSSESFAPALGETVQISVGGTAVQTSLSAGHAGNWFYRSPSGVPFSHLWDGISATAPVLDAKGTACAIASQPASASLQSPVCVDLSVDDNSGRPANDWYLAEGATAYGFETYILVQNPNTSPATVAVTYMTPDGPTARPSLVVPPKSRRTIVVAADLPGTEVSARLQSDVPVVVERAMYWRGADGNWREAHAVVATRRPSNRWYLPEGSTNWGFDEWVLLQNPGSTDAVATLDFVAQDGRRLQHVVTVKAGSRSTIRVADLMPAADVATEIQSNLPIVAERAMYWGGSYPASAGGSAAVGLLAPSSTWYFAEGSSDWGFETWTLLLNPNDSPVGVDVVYMTRSGPKVRSGITMPPKSRESISMGWDIGPTDSAIFIRASHPILAERAMYYSPDGSPAGSSRAGHASQGSSSPSRSWRLAEGSTAHGLHEYILVQNPGSQSSKVQFNLQTEGGDSGTYTFEVAPGARLTVYLNSLIPSSDVSVAITSSEPVVVDRAMYTRDELGYLVMQGANGAK
jgi:hypothetical protein